MSYQVLARKWRPQQFTAMVGQTHVLQVLRHALEHQRLHHAYLFTGTRGVGKTTVARILAKCLVCEKGVTASPCQQCEACQAIAAGRYVDLIEVDGASRTKVEDTRELLDNVQYMPTVGRYKIYLIDEVHMLSTHSFNALLKTLEEPPDYVKFLLATTDPERLPATVLSRCLQFHLKALPIAAIAEHLAHILQAEQHDYEPAACRHLAKAACGSIRDALSLLEQAIAYGGGRVVEADVCALLGTIGRAPMWTIIRLLVEQDACGLLAEVARIAEQGVDFDVILAELLSALAQLALFKAVPEAYTDDTEQGDCDALAKQLSAQDIQLFYQIALLGRRDLPLAPDARIGFEMIMLRMLGFYPVEASSLPLTPPSASEKKAHKPAQQPATAMSKTTAKRNDDDSGQQQNSAIESLQERRTTVESLDWAALVARLDIDGMTLALANQCALKQMTASTVELALAPQHKPLYNKTQAELLTHALSQAMGRDMRVSVQFEATSQATPAQQRSEQLAQQQAAMVSDCRSDPNVQAIMETFGARIDEQAIQPLTVNATEKVE